MALHMTWKHKCLFVVLILNKPQHKHTNFLMGKSDWCWSSPSPTMFTLQPFSIKLEPPLISTYNPNHNNLRIWLANIGDPWFHPINPTLKKSHLTNWFLAKFPSLAIDYYYYYLESGTDLGTYF